MIDNGILKYNNAFRLGLFGGTSQVDISLSQTRVDLDTVLMIFL